MNENPIHLTPDDAKRIIPDMDTIHVHRKSNINITLFESNYSRTFIRRAIIANAGNLTIAPPDMIERGYGLQITDDVGMLFVRTEPDELQKTIERLTPKVEPPKIETTPPPPTPQQTTQGKTESKTQTPNAKSKPNTGNNKGK